MITGWEILSLLISTGTLYPAIFKFEIENIPHCRTWINDTEAVVKVNMKYDPHPMA